MTPLAKDELTGPRGAGYRRMIEGCPAKRTGTPDEVGNVAALLIGPDGAFITGSDFLMDGGVTSPTGSANWRRQSEASHDRAHELLSPPVPCRPRDAGYSPSAALRPFISATKIKKTTPRDAPKVLATSQKEEGETALGLDGEKVFSPGSASTLSECGVCLLASPMTQMLSNCPKRHFITLRSPPVNGLDIALRMRKTLF